jgi:hypothetical protein
LLEAFATAGINVNIALSFTKDERDFGWDVAKLIKG